MRKLLRASRAGCEEEATFTSDNGPKFGVDRYASAYDPQSTEEECSTTRCNCQFNGANLSVYEGGTCVPVIVRWLAGQVGAAPLP